MGRSRFLIPTILLLLGIFHLSLRWHGLRLPLIIDEGDYAYEARIWSQGGLPYRDAFDQKPPNIYLIYRAAAIVSDNPKAARVLAIFFSLATMGLLYSICPISWPLAARFSAPAAYAVLSTEPLGDLGFTANTEVFLAFFTALAAWCWTKIDARHRWPWVFNCGLACGAALMTKQTALWTLIAFGALCCWRAGNHRTRSAAHFAGGAIVIPAIWSLYFLLRGGFAEFYADAFARNVSYAGFVYSPSILQEHLRWFFVDVVPAMAKGDWPFYVLVLFGFLGVNVNAKHSMETMTTLWLGTAIIGAITGLFLFPHYYLQVYPALALAVATGIKKLSTVRPRWKWSWVVLAATLYPVCVRAQSYFFDPPQITARKLLYPNPLYESVKIAEVIRSRTSPSDSIYIFGSETQIYVYAGRRCATKHIFSYPLTLFPKGQAEIDNEIATLRSTRPQVIVYSAQPFSTLIGSTLGLEFRDSIRRLLAERYQWVGHVQIFREKSIYEFDPHRLKAVKPDWNDDHSIFIFERRT